ncbi:hypothetical protein BYT27DRAFT_7264673 [Phlegmacium glaucopus]|nr:hypothetical protein BYT27DRAFT_7264673 [Phlegmacium glaucopus]
MAPNPDLNYSAMDLRSSAVATKVAKSFVDTKTEAEMAGKQGSRDTLSLLVRSNLSEEAKTCINKEEMMPQMRTILIDGYDTTATTLSWTLLEIVRRPEMQPRPRDEIRDMERKINEFSANDFENMPYPTAVIKLGRKTSNFILTKYRLILEMATNMHWFWNAKEDRRPWNDSWRICCDAWRQQDCKGKN